MATATELYNRFSKIKAKRQSLESTWAECYEFALPQREGLFGYSSSQIEKLFDGTAPDSVDQLAASMLSELTPGWMKWFDLMPGAEINAEESVEANQTLEYISDVIQTHLDRSSFTVEIHQCFLDLITAGTACLLLEEAPIGFKSAFRFTAVPLSEVFVEEGYSGLLDVTFRETSVTPTALLSRFPNISFKKQVNDDTEITLIESVVPRIKGGYDYMVFVKEDPEQILGDMPHTVLKEGYFDSSPFITFRWQKAPGETYGRSPVMKALPDIKTANKVVELVLKNATISVTGIWQAEDDGVLNPANIRLVPGSIIPKAVGSKGLTPLEPAGNFDVSQLVLDDLRSRIRHALLADRLGQINEAKMTATEVMERSDEMSRILGASYSRLQTELLNPLMERCVSILRRRGQIPDLYIDGRLIDIQYKSPIKRKHMENTAKNALTWINALTDLGADSLSYLNINAFIGWLAQSLNLPAELLKLNNGAANESV